MAFYESPLDPKSDYVIYEWYLSDSDDSDRRRFNMWMLELKELWASFITVFWLVFLLEIILKNLIQGNQIIFQRCPSNGLGDY